MNKEIIFKAKHNKPRHELSLPDLVFYHSDHWMNVLGLEIFSAWIMIYTWCDRQQYPADNVSHHKDIKEVAAAFKCSANTAQKIIKTLYEYGLLDIVQVKNKYGGFKNIYYWYEIPVYADSMYCELRKVRSWKDRNWHGQELSKLSKIKNKKTAMLKSRIKNEYGSKNSQENSELARKPYHFLIRQPYQKMIHSNDLNNNKRSVVIVDQPAGEKILNHETASSSVENDGAAFDLPLADTPGNGGSGSQRTDREEKGPKEKTPNEPLTWEQIRVNVREVAGAEISVGFAKEIAKNYSPVKIDSTFSELRRQLAQGIEIRGVGAWLRFALENDIQPDQPATKTIPKRGNCNNNRTPRARPEETSYPKTSKQQRDKKELIRSLYT